MKQVLCIQRSAIKPFKDLEDTDMVIMDRSYVDGKNINLYQNFPQVIPIILIKDEENSFLVYTRQGTETRLDNKMSLTLGGHVDLQDLTNTCYKKGMYDFFKNSLLEAASRELEEEAGIYHLFTENDFENSIYLTDDDVSKVHVGYPTIKQIQRVDFHPTHEVANYQWMPLEECMSNFDNFETWSKHLLNNHLKIEKPTNETTKS